MGCRPQIRADDGRGSARGPQGEMEQGSGALKILDTDLNLDPISCRSTGQSAQNQSSGGPQPVLGGFFANGFVIENGDRNPRADVIDRARRPSRAARNGPLMALTGCVGLSVSTSVVRG